MDDELKNGIILRLNKIINITAEAKDEFIETTDVEKAYSALHADMCNACAHMDHALASIHARMHEKQITEALEKEKKAKKGKRYKKDDRRKRKE
jgi:hypothetical protein